MTQEELQLILADHKKWCADSSTGKRAYLRDADLRDADLRGADLVSAYLVGAYLSGANLAGANLVGAYLEGAYLEGAYLSDADLRDADLRGANLVGADLRSANLRGANLRGADLRSANLRSANLRGANLRGANLRSANLRGANLRGANLSGANLSGADLPHLDDISSIPMLHTAILAQLDAGNGFDMAEWHTCETTHCRAGWAIHLAGEAGYELEKRLGSNVAGGLITLRSCPELNGIVPNWNASNDEALADIKRLAALEQAR